MTAAIVDSTSTNKLISSNKTTESKLNTKFGLNGKFVTERQNEQTNYYYSSGSFNFIFDKGFKPETLEDIELTSVPFVPDWHKGIVSVHGLIIPVIDILSFVKSQNLELSEERTSKKSYLLKLEHKSYSPLVLKLDALPLLINVDNYKKTSADQSSPKWLKYYLENESSKVAFIDHKELFNQIINS